MRHSFPGCRPSSERILVPHRPITATRLVATLTHPPPLPRLGNLFRNNQPPAHSTTCQPQLGTSTSSPDRQPHHLLPLPPGPTPPTTTHHLLPLHILFYSPARPPIRPHSRRHLG